jgi:hypothetical protein
LMELRTPRTPRTLQPDLSFPSFGGVRALGKQSCGLFSARTADSPEQAPKGQGGSDMIKFPSFGGVPRRGGVVIGKVRLMLGLSYMKVKGGEAIVT